MLTTARGIRIAVIAVATHGAAHAAHDFAAAISSADIDQYIAWLDLDRVQSISVRSLRGPYWISYRERASDGAAMLAEMRIDLDDRMAASQYTAHAAARDAIAVELASMDTVFLGDVEGVLTEAQRRRFRRVEMHRMRQRALPRLHYFLESTGRPYIDATELFAPMLTGPEAAMPLIEQLERTQTSLLTELQAAHDRSTEDQIRRWVAAGRPQGEAWSRILGELAQPSIELARRMDRALLDAVATTRAACAGNLDAHDAVMMKLYPEAAAVLDAAGTLRRAMAAVADLPEDDRAAIGDVLEAARLELAALQRGVVTAVDRRYERASQHPPDFVEIQKRVFGQQRAARDRALALLAELESAVPRRELWAAKGPDLARREPRAEPARVTLDAVFAWAGVEPGPALEAWRVAYTAAKTVADLDAADGAFVAARPEPTSEERRDWVLASTRRGWLAGRTYPGGATAVDIAALAIMVAGDDGVRKALASPALAYYATVNPLLEERWRRANPNNRSDVYADLDAALLEATWTHRDALVSILPPESHATFDAVFAEVAFPYMLHGVESFETMRARYLDDIAAAPEETVRQAEVVMLEGLERANEVVARLVATLRDALWWFEDADGALVPAGLRPADTWDRVERVRALRQEYGEVVGTTALNLDRVLATGEAVRRP